MGLGGSLKTRLASLALGATAAVLVFLASLSSFFHQIEWKTLDWRFAHRPEPERPAPMVHIDIDDSSIETWGRWPWPFERHAQLIRLLRELGARDIVFDVTFPSSSGPAGDNALAAAMRDAGNVHVAFSLEVGQAFLPVRQRRQTGMSGPPGAHGAELRAALADSFDADELELSGRLGLPPGVIGARLVTLKRTMAEEAAFDILRETGELNDNRLLARLMPGRDAFASWFVRHAIVPAAVDHGLALREVYAKSARPASEVARRAFPGAARAATPLACFARAAAGFGVSNTPPDPDGVIRHVTLFYALGDRLLPHLSLATACRLLGADVRETDIVPGARVVLHTPEGELAVPIDAEGRLLVNWPVTGDVDWPDIFTHVAYGSFLELESVRENVAENRPKVDQVCRDYDRSFDGEWARSSAGARAAVESKMLDKLRRDTRLAPDEEKDLTADERHNLAQMRHYLAVLEMQQRLSAREKDVRDRLAAAVAGKLCLVGMTATGSTDLKPTPVHRVYPGVGVHSAVVNSILQRAFVREAPAWLNALLVVATALGVSQAAGRLSTRWAAAVSATIIVGWAVAAWALFAYAGAWAGMAGPVLAGVLAYAAVTAWRHFTEERQKRHIREAFQHYLAPSVVAQVISQPDLLKLGGERKELTVFFSDVAGFTPIAETMEPEELVALLNDYLSEMSQVILESNGYLNKYEGDAIMAVFGAPLEDPEHAAGACRVALESQRRLREFRERLARENRPIIRARIGINSGVMLVGNMGSYHRFDYTVMGDNVNVGARLEGANKAFGTEIMIGENTYRLVKDLFDVRRLGLVAVKGRTRPVGAWELIAEKGKCPPLIAKLLPAYERGLAAYGEQNWAEAQALFKECLTLDPDDGPSRAYLNRCLELSRAPRVENWDGTFTLEGK